MRTTDFRRNVSKDSLERPDKDMRTNSGIGALIHGIHHIEIYVDDQAATARFYQSALGFKTIAACATDDKNSLVVGTSDIRIVLTAPLGVNSPVAEHLRLHGEGIKDIALSVSSIDRVFRNAVECGGEPSRFPEVEQDISGAVRIARICTFGDLVHSLVDASDYHGCFVPGFDPVPDVGGESTIERIDHVALAVSSGELDRCVEFYAGALAFRETHQEDVSTEYSAMRSKVVQTADGNVCFPMMEPAAGRRKSQIENFITAHKGPGAQHIAFQSRDIVQSVSIMTASGVEFLAIPQAYYDYLPDRVGDVPMGIDTLRGLGILADCDTSGLLLQIFTRPVVGRPTLFLELIQRLGAEGFGSGNIKALFEAVERAQSAGSGN